MEPTEQTNRTECGARVQRLTERFVAALGDEFVGDTLDAVESLLDRLEAYRRVVEPPNRPHTLSGGTGGGKGQGEAGASNVGQTKGVGGPAMTPVFGTRQEGPHGYVYVEGVKVGPFPSFEIDAKPSLGHGNAGASPKPPPPTTIRGTVLNHAQETALRAAIATFLSSLADGDGYDAGSRNLRDEYVARCNEIQVMFLGGGK